MGGEIKLSEKEKWAAYFSAILKHSGYPDASKYLHVLAYGRRRPIDDLPIGLEADDKNYVRILNAIIEAQKEIEKNPIKHVSKKPFKPTLQEDIHGDKEGENV